MSLAEFQRLTADYLVRCNKQRPHWSLEGLTPHENYMLRSKLYLLRVYGFSPDWTWADN
jgi:hypothetical protein